MRYRVPQYIEIEDKIFWNLSFKQFIYIGGGAGMAYLAWMYIPKPFNSLLAVLLGAFGVALAFYKYNGKPLISMLEAIFNYLVRPKLYLWKIRKRKSKKENKNSYIKTMPEPKLTEGKLSQLAWDLDINENIHFTRTKEIKRIAEHDLVKDFMVSFNQ